MDLGHMMHLNLLHFLFILRSKNLYLPIVQMKFHTERLILSLGDKGRGRAWHGGTLETTKHGDGFEEESGWLHDARGDDIKVW